jgi:hypothetical protein
MFKKFSTYILLKKYIKRDVWRVAVFLYYIQDAWILKVKQLLKLNNGKVCNCLTQILHTRFNKNESHTF